MNMLPVLYTAWIASAAMLLTLMVYRSTLMRYENKKLFLSDYEKNNEIAETEIVRKVTRIQPLVNIIGTAAGVTSIGIVAVRVYEAILVLRS
jgi:hypothetical protein